MAYECVTNRNRRIIPSTAFVCNWLALEERREADSPVLIPGERREERNCEGGGRGEGMTGERKVKKYKKSGL